jgi:hypothetical protein
MSISAFQLGFTTTCRSPQIAQLLKRRLLREAFQKLTQLPQGACKCSRAIAVCIYTTKRRIRFPRSRRFAGTRPTRLPRIGRSFDHTKAQGNFLLNVLDHAASAAASSISKCLHCPAHTLPKAPLDGYLYVRSPINISDPRQTVLYPFFLRVTSCSC